MKAALALALGYFLGTRSGRKDLTQLTHSLEALCATEEFGDVVVALRSQLGSSLRGLADVVEGASELPELSGDLVAKVRRLVGSD